MTYDANNFFSSGHFDKPRAVKISLEATGRPSVTTFFSSIKRERQSDAVRSHLMYYTSVIGHAL